MLAKVESVNPSVVQTLCDSCNLMKFSEHEC